MKRINIKGLFRKSKAEVISVDNPYGDYYTVKLKPAKDTQWEAGEHGIFTISDKKVEGKRWRGFSVASIEREGHILLGTRTGKDVSSYKQQLIMLKAGDEIDVRGPFGWFLLQDETTPIVLIAAGVGITPIRALLKEVENKNKRDVEVIYSSADFYLFGDEIEDIASVNDKITLTKTTTVENTQNKIAEAAIKYKNAAYYYISGSPKVINSIKEHLKRNGVKGSRVINDPFLGY